MEGKWKEKKDSGKIVVDTCAKIKYLYHNGYTVTKSLQTVTKKVHNASYIRMYRKKENENK